jgi:hypothetical protein
MVLGLLAHLPVAGIFSYIVVWFPETTIMLYPSVPAPVGLSGDCLTNAQPQQFIWNFVLTCTLHSSVDSFLHFREWVANSSILVFG